MRYCDLNTGLAGAQLGLRDLQFDCVLPLEPRVDASAVYRGMFDHCTNLEPDRLTPRDLPDCDAVWYRAPASQLRPAISNGGGITPTQKVIHLLRERQVPLIVIASSRALLHEMFGCAMAWLVLELTRLHYLVYWCRLNPLQIGLPHDTLYTFLVAVNVSLDAPRDRSLLRSIRIGGARIPFLSDLLDRMGIVANGFASGDLKQEMASRWPRLGVARPRVATPFRSFGVALGEQYVTFSGRPRFLAECSPTLAEVVCPGFRDGDDVSAVRLLSRHGRTSVAVKARKASYAMGPGYSAGPLFAIPRSRTDGGSRPRLLEHANWVRERDGLIVFRLKPSRAVLFHGWEAERLVPLLREMDAPVLRQYELVAGIVPPAVTKLLAQIHSGNQPLPSGDSPHAAATERR